MGREAYAFSEMIDRTTLPRGICAPSERLPPSVLTSEACESLLAHLTNKGAVAAKYLVRHFLGSQQTLGNDKMGTAY